MWKYVCNSSPIFSKQIKMGMDRKTDTFLLIPIKQIVRNTTFFPYNCRSELWSKKRLLRWRTLLTQDSIGYTPAINVVSLQTGRKTSSIYLSVSLSEKLISRNFHTKKTQCINRVILELDKFTKYIFMAYLPPTE